MYKNDINSEEYDKYSEIIFYYILAAVFLNLVLYFRIEVIYLLIPGILALTLFSVSILSTSSKEFSINPILIT